MRKRGGRTHAQCLSQIKLVVFYFEEYLELFIREKVASVGWNAAEGHDVRPFPKPQKTLILVENLRNTLEGQFPAAHLNVGLAKIKLVLHHLPLLCPSGTYYNVLLCRRSILKIWHGLDLPAITCFQKGIASSLVSQSRNSSDMYFGSTCRVTISY